MTEDEKRDFLGAIHAADPWDPYSIYRAIAPLIAKAKREAWCAGRDAASGVVADDECWPKQDALLLILAIEPPADL